MRHGETAQSSGAGIQIAVMDRRLPVTANPTPPRRSVGLPENCARSRCPNVDRHVCDVARELGRGRSADTSRSSESTDVGTVPAFTASGENDHPANHGACVAQQHEFPVRCGVRVEIERDRDLPQIQSSLHERAFGGIKARRRSDRPHPKPRIPVGQVTYMITTPSASELDADAGDAKYKRVPWSSGCS